MYRGRRVDVHVLGGFTCNLHSKKRIFILDILFCFVVLGGTTQNILFAQLVVDSRGMIGGSFTFKADLPVQFLHSARFIHKFVRRVI